MGNGTSIRNFGCLTAGSKSMSRGIGALLPNENPLTRDVGALTGNIETLTADGVGSTFNIGALTFDVGALQAIVANIGKLAGLRHQVQLAAEQAFPWRNSGVASIRQSFLLPTDRPMPGK